MYIGAQAFSPVPDLAAAKALFARSVERVEVETHSYCNRRCDYCPNVVGDRLGENKRMPEDLWWMVINDLAEIGYAHKLVFTSYNEPLADRLIIERVAQARQALPQAQLMIYSNGDYLNADYLHALSEAGLDALHISIHARHGAPYAEVPALNNIARLGRRLGLPLQFTTFKPGQFILAKVPHARVEIDVRAVNYWQQGTDRGGLIAGGNQAQGRTRPCFFPFSHFHVGFEGTVVPCCHIRSDSPAHTAFRYGNLSDFGSVFAAYASRAAIEWRRALISPEPKKPPCDTCTTAYLSEDPQVLAHTEQAWRRHVLGKPLPPA